jgi:hypothetical protein
MSFSYEPIFRAVGSTYFPGDLHYNMITKMSFYYVNGLEDVLFTVSDNGYNAWTNLPGKTRFFMKMIGPDGISSSLTPQPTCVAF